MKKPSKRSASRSGVSFVTAALRVPSAPGFRPAPRPAWGGSRWRPAAHCPASARRCASPSRPARRPDRAPAHPAAGRGSPRRPSRMGLAGSKGPQRDRGVCPARRCTRKDLKPRGAPRYGGPLPWQQAEQLLRLRPSACSRAAPRSARHRNWRGTRGIRHRAGTPCDQNTAGIPGMLRAACCVLRDVGRTSCAFMAAMPLCGFHVARFTFHASAIAQPSARGSLPPQSTPVSGSRRMICPRPKMARSWPVMAATG